MIDRCLNTVMLKNAKKSDLSPSRGLSVDNIKTYLLINKNDGAKMIRQQDESNNSLPSYKEFDIHTIYRPGSGFNLELKTIKAINAF